MAARRQRVAAAVLALAALIWHAGPAGSQVPDPDPGLLRALRVDAEAVAQQALASGDPATPGRREGCSGDPAGDTLPGPLPAADIVRVCVAYDRDLLVTVTPAQAPQGSGGFTAALEVTGDDTADLTLAVLGAGLQAGVLDEAGELVCPGAAAWDGTSLSASVTADCIGAPAEVRSFVTFVHERAHGDVVPNAGALTAAAGPPPARETQRLSGPDRYATAVAISRHVFPDTADEVYLARADAVPDALAASSLTTGPLLLVPPCAPLPEVVRTEIARLNPLRIYALGGPSAVCDNVLAEAAAL